jgi:GNAT superfamily N-acetyltransferase
MSEGFTVRRATPDDIETLVCLRLEMQREIVDGHVNWNAVEEATRTYLTAKLPGEEFIVVVAEAEGQLVATGGVSFVTRPPSSNTLSQWECYISNMYTRPAWRRKGVATAILERTLEHARERGARRIYLRATDAGRKVYKKLAFAKNRRYMQRNLE